MEFRSNLFLPFLAIFTLFTLYAYALPPLHDQQVLADILEQRPIHTTALLAGAAMAPTPATPIYLSYKARNTRAALAMKLRSRPLNMRHAVPGDGTEEVEDREPL